MGKGHIPRHAAHKTSFPFSPPATLRGRGATEIVRWFPQQQQQQEQLLHLRPDLVLLIQAVCRGSLWGRID